MARWLQGGYPLSISTDDSTVFGTTASRELALVAETCGLSAEQLGQLCQAALGQAFEPDVQLMRELGERFATAISDAVASFGAEVET